VSNTEQSNQAVGSRTAAGFAQSNAPIPQLRHDPFAGGSIHVNDTAPIAPTTGPCAADERPDMAQVHLEIDRDKTRQ
jgi:hypothetical protein